MDDVRDALTRKIKVLNEAIWEHRIPEPLIQAWLDNFRRQGDESVKERLHALFLLSNIMYFGSRQMRELLKALYRDLYRYPVVQSIRKEHDDTLDQTLIGNFFHDELLKTRFLGVGNPSESGCHLLYYFRQENSLPKTQFIHTHEIFHRDTETGLVTLRSPDVKRYVFIDDFCGSGNQATKYSRDIVLEVKRLHANVVLAYYVLFATSDGIQRVRSETAFDEVACIYELDSSFRCFHREARYFASPPIGIDKSYAEAMSRCYGLTLVPTDPLGYDDCQLLIAFHHNTPDNTLPIIWYDEPDGEPWTPVFRRYPKYYGWAQP